jgi:dUTPase
LSIDYCEEEDMWSIESMKKMNKQSNVPKYRFALREDLKEEKQFIPTRGEPKATGWDVRAAFLDRKSIIVKPFQKLAIPLGVRGFCPDGWWYEIKPRSSSYVKKHLNALYGTIDETYEGELIFACQYIPEFKLIHPQITMGATFKTFESELPDLTINFGDAIAQIIPIRREEMEVEECTNEEYNDDCKTRNGVRKDGGFGSTNK